MHCEGSKHWFETFHDSTTPFPQQFNHQDLPRHDIICRKRCTCLVWLDIVLENAYWDSFPHSVSTLMIQFGQCPQLQRLNRTRLAFRVAGLSERSTACCLSSFIIHGVCSHLMPNSGNTLGLSSYQNRLKRKLCHNLTLKLPLDMSRNLIRRFLPHSPCPIQTLSQSELQVKVLCYTIKYIDSITITVGLTHLSIKEYTCDVHLHVSHAFSICERSNKVLLGGKLLTTRKNTV